MKPWFENYTLDIPSTKEVQINLSITNEKKRIYVGLEKTHPKMSNAWRQIFKQYEILKKHLGIKLHTRSYNKNGKQLLCCRMYIDLQDLGPLESVVEIKDGKYLITDVSTYYDLCNKATIEYLEWCEAGRYRQATNLMMNVKSDTNINWPKVNN